jgi:NADPH:quinone reductase-like Zn-dependent oxidoreductase
VSILTLVQDGDVKSDTERAAGRGFTKVLSIMEFDRVGAELGEILEMMNEGLVKTPPLTTYSLDAAPEVLQHLKDRRVRGKIVLTTAA